MGLKSHSFLSPKKKIDGAIEWVSLQMSESWQVWRSPKKSKEPLTLELFAVPSWYGENPSIK